MDYIQHNNISNCNSESARFFLHVENFTGTRRKNISYAYAQNFLGKALLVILLMTIGYTASWAQTVINDLSGITDANGNYVITQDISVGTPGVTSFSGTLTAQAKSDGTYPVISGLSSPLFTTVTGSAKISNIMLEDVQISGSGAVGAICGTADGSARIYNCGILPASPKFPAEETSTISSSNSYCGSLVGQLSGNARVINCFSYATITGGTTVAGIVGYIGNTEITQGNVTTVPMVVNCMFYGEISGGNAKYPVYGGKTIKNERDNGVNPYNYFRKNATFDNGYTSIDNYNRSWPAEEKNLTRFEYYRSVLNSNRKLCTWWVTGKQYGASTDAPTEDDEALIAKWVLDPSIAPYPILKKWGYYPSVINLDPNYRINPDTKAKEARSGAKEWEGKSYGTISVSINAGSQHNGSTSRTITITDMDTLNNDFGYYKIQLPYYNEVFGNPNGTTWDAKYGGNYTTHVVTGWEITSITGGTPGTFTKDWNTGYNFADRECTNKDKYSESGRIFAQGGYYYVPKGVTGIAITAHWGKAFYLANRGYSIDRVNVTNKNYKEEKAFSPAGTVENTFQGQTVYNDLQDAIRALDVYTSDQNDHVCDQAIVLIGNHQVKNGNNKIGYGLDSKWHPFTIMSADLDFDNEPDNCLELQFRSNTDRPGIQPIRFDFLPVVELGLAVRHDKKAYAIGIFVPQGHFEVTETAFLRTTQFEYDGPKHDNNRVSGKSPMIINGGEYEMFNYRYHSSDRTSYFLLGGKAWVHRFAPGAHPNKGDSNKYYCCAINAIGGEFKEFYLSGIYRPDITAPQNQGDAHCYTNGGRFGLLAGAGYDKIAGGVTFKINHSNIGEFYGGGINGSNPLGGNINVTIDYSRVGKYCGGPKVGNMSGKTVTTNATGTTFDIFFGGGNGGNSYYRDQQFDGDQNSSHIATWTDNTYNWNGFNPLGVKDDGTTNKGYHAEYEFEVFNQSNGVEDKITQRSFIRWIQFGLTITSDVSNTLSDCTINSNFYGGGNLANVTGDVTSKLTNTTVHGNAFGAGYSAKIPTFSVHDKSNYTFPSMDYAGTITDGSIGYKKEGDKVITYEWTNETNGKSTSQLNADPTFKIGDKWYCYTWNSLQGLGTVTGNVTLDIEGNTLVEGNVFETNDLGVQTVKEQTGGAFGGGDASDVVGNTTVKIDASGQQTEGYNVYNVFGGGNKATVTGEATVNLIKGIVNKNLFGGGNEADVTRNTSVNMTGGEVRKNIYGGGNLGSVGTFDVLNTAKPTTCTDGTGTCTVAISNGSVGPAGEMAADWLSSYTGDNIEDDRFIGHVFGASKGIVGADATLPFKTFVNKTDVTISGSAFVKGSVYGGSQNGHVLNDTWVKITGGQIGCGAGQSEPYTSTDFINPVSTSVTTGLAECPSWAYESPFAPYDPNANKTGDLDKYSNGASTGGGRHTASDGHTFYGNVFGGGSGYFPYKDADGQSQWLATAGEVGGNTKVEISGGHILTSIYGGNELTNVKGDCTVTMSSGTLGVPRTLDQIAAHPVTCYLFGAGKGDQRAFFNEATNVQNANVTVSGNTIIYGSVFGGGEDGHVLGDVKVKIDKTAGDSFEANSKTYSFPVIGTHGTSYVEGNIFGGGRGYSGEALTEGVVSGNIDIDITGGTMLGSVYGGGRLGSVGAFLAESTDIGENGHYGKLIPDGKQQEIHSDGSVTVVDAPGVTHGHITIDISGGTIGNEHEYVYPTAAQKTGELKNTEFNSSDQLLNTKGGSVYAGSMGRLFLQDGTTPIRQWNDLGKARKTTLNITGGTIKSCVYGGSELGQVEETTTVNITGGSIGTQVPAGGEGKPSYFFGDVFGGGKGSIATLTYPSGYSEIEKPLVSEAGKVGGDVLVELNKGKAATDKGATVNRIFGCNNVNGTPLGNVTVHVYATQNREKGQIANTPEDTQNSIAAVTDAKRTGIYDVSAVYGGGNEAAYIPTTPSTSETSGSKTQVIIEGCQLTSIETVYGGGNAASVPETNVNINSAFEIGTVFGGGNGKDKKSDGSDNPGANVGVYKNVSGVDTNYGTGNANTWLNGGTIHEAYGGSNELGTIIGKANVYSGSSSGCPLNVGKIYGGGKNADMSGGTNIVLGCMPDRWIGEIYAGAEAADIESDVSLTITSGKFERVFGGNKTSGLLKGSITVNIEETGSCEVPIIIGELYGGGYKADYSIYGYKNTGTEQNPVWAPRESSTDSGTGPTTPYADPKLNIRSFTSIGAIYGGGLEAKMVANPKVDINVVKGSHYDDDDLAAGTTPAANLPYPAHENGNIGSIGNVFGGGNLANVIGNTTVNVGTETTVGFITEPIHLRTELDVPLQKNAETGLYDITVEGANIINNVYGGGNQADIIGDAQVNICAKANQPVPAGTAGVTIAGDVFGAGKGLTTNVNNTRVVMAGGSVAKSVYGGGELGTVDQETYITVMGGNIGDSQNEQGGATIGNVYGGGLGNTENITAGLIKGNTNVTIQNFIANAAYAAAHEGVEVDDVITSPNIYHNIYGGGAHGSVGTFTYASEASENPAVAVGDIIGYTDDTGITNVTITGGTIGINGKENGMVFGSSRGDVGAPASIHDQLAWVYDANVVIGTANAETGPTIKGSVYGSGENGHTYHNTEVTIHSGTIGIHDNSSDDATRGNVYGGGCGTDKYDNNTKYNPLSGIVRGTTKVAIDGGHVLRNVYGAGAMGSVGNDADATSGKTTIEISGGRIGTDGNDNGNVFGAARGQLGESTDISKNLAHVQETDVKIQYANTPDGDNTGHTEQIITGSVFGGGEAGIVKGAVSVSVSGGYVANDVYGGGALANTNTNNWVNNSIVYSYEAVTSPSSTDGLYTRSGSAEPYTYAPASGEVASGTTYYKRLNSTTVSLSGGNIHGSLYGGGLGENTTGNEVAALVYGNVTVTTTGGKAGNVYGCNNKLGAPQGAVLVTIDGTDAATAPDYAIGNVYGGGNLADYEYANTNDHPLTVLMKNGIVNNIYGGGNQADVTGSINVTVSGGRVVNDVYGGGALANTNTGNWSATKTADEYLPLTQKENLYH